jgi:hypothetical protein
MAAHAEQQFSPEDEGETLVSTYKITQPHNPEDKNQYYSRGVR